jgi:endo-1,4-beta-xylanase
MRLSRRDCMALGLAAALPLDPALAAKKKVLAGSAPGTLNAVAKTRGLMFGSAIGLDSTPEGLALLPPEVLARPRRPISFDDPDNCALIERECGVVVHENELKWYVVRPNAKTFDFARADRIVRWARQKSLAVRGHNLLWNAMRWTPRWVAGHDFGRRPATACEKMLTEHIFKVCKRYGRNIFSYDVINETINPKTGALEDTPFTKHLGWNVIDICFHAARQAAPHAELVYNDFPSWNPDGTHRAAILKLLEYAKKKNLPVDALGVQAHIGFPNTGGVAASRDETAWVKFLGDVSSMGYGLLVTEFDINDKPLPTDIDSRDRTVADLGRAFLDIMLADKATRTVMVWGMVDKHSWLQEFVPRADGLPQRCAPYDDHYLAKPLREAFAAALAAAPLRPAVKPG